MNNYTLTLQQIEQLRATWASASVTETEIPPLADLIKPLLLGTEFETRTCAPGEVICREGEHEPIMYMVQSGQISIVKGELDDPVVLAERGAGELIGEMALLDHQPRSASVIALDEVKLLCVHKADFERLLTSHPDLTMSILTTLSSRLRIADDIRTAIYRLEKKMEHELEVAGQVQANLVPDDTPDLSGWTISPVLIPARQTSGDYYDFIDLDNGQLGILVADVVDKGAAAAMLMAVSRTLIHAFAKHYPTEPGRVYEIANNHLLRDTTTDMFITSIFGVLDPASGQFMYLNAGHNPAYLFRAGGEIETLKTTGLPLGSFEDVTWEVKPLQINTGDVLVLYSDGLTEARNADSEEFRTDRLEETVRAHRADSAVEIRNWLLAALQDFVKDAPQHDDITVMVIKRG